MPDKALKKVISTYLAQAAYSLLAKGTSLSKEDVRILREDGPKLAKKVKNAKKSKAFDGMSEDDKRLLLAYVVYFRQNLTTDNGLKPNDEDAAKILHGEVFKGDDKEARKEARKRLEQELVRQLQKAGVSLEDK